MELYLITTDSGKGMETVSGVVTVMENKEIVTKLLNWYLENGYNVLFLQTWKNGSFVKEEKFTSF